MPLGASSIAWVPPPRPRWLGDVQGRHRVSKCLIFGSVSRQFSARLVHFPGDGVGDRHGLATWGEIARRPAGRAKTAAQADPKRKEVPEKLRLSRQNTLPRPTCTLINTGVDTNRAQPYTGQSFSSINAIRLKVLQHFGETCKNMRAKDFCRTAGARLFTRPLTANLNFRPFQAAKANTSATQDGKPEQACHHDTPGPLGPRELIRWDRLCTTNPKVRDPLVTIGVPACAI